MRFSIKIMLCITALGCSPLRAQFPGGIGGNLKIWIRSDNGLTTSGTAVTQWTDNSGAGVTGNFGVNQYGSGFPTQTSPTTQQAALNFNTYVGFNGTSNSLSSNNAFLGGQVFDANNNTFFQVIRYKSGGVWFKWETDNGGTHRVGFESNSNRLRCDFPEAIAGIGINNTSTANIANQHELVSVTTDANTSQVRLNGLNNGTKNIAAAGAFSDIGLTERLTLGNNLMFNLPAQIDMAEIICYKAKLIPADINKVESYLAIKYGFTLDQSTAQNYVSAAAAIVWDAAANLGYNKDITGIGRDDNSTLNQRQSRNNSLADAVTTSLGSIAVDNAANAGAFTSDASFLTWGHNGQTLVFAPSASVPQGLSQRLNRAWKAQQSNFTQAVTISFETSMLPASVPAASIRLLVDDDGNFSNARVYTGAVNAGRLQFTNQDFDSYTKMYYTLATCTTTAPLLSYNNPVCGGQTVNLQENNPSYTDPSTNYAWSGPNAFTSAVQNPSVASLSPATAGTYSLVLSVNTCTLPTGTVSVAVSAAPDVNAGASQTITCTLPTVTISASSTTTPVSYAWMGPAGYASGSQNAPVTSSGNYTVTVTNTLTGCTNTAAVTVSTNTTLPDANAGSTPTITCTAPATLNGSSLTSGAGFAWAGPNGYAASVATPTVNNIGDYTLTVTDPTNGCTQTATVSVAINNNLTVTANPLQASICAGDSIMLTPGGAQTYTLMPSSIGSFTQPVYVSPSAITSYTLTGTLGLCSASVAISVTVNPLPVATFSTSYTDEANFDGNLVTQDLSSGATHWTWNFGDGSSPVDAQQPPHAYDTFSPATYTITETVSTDFGCTDKATLVIRISPISTLYVPNAFTPNGNSVNETFGGIGIGVSTYQMQIYNRWGQLIFSSDSIEKQWDGRKSGILCETGLYVYQISIVDIYRKEKTVTGYVELLR